jgi:hypothetical protein
MLAMAKVIEDGGAQLAVESVVCRDWWSRRSRRRDPRRLGESLRRVRRAFGDDGELRYEKPVQKTWMQKDREREAAREARWREYCERVRRETEAFEREQAAARDPCGRS